MLSSYMKMIIAFGRLALTSTKVAKPRVQTNYLHKDRMVIPMPCVVAASAKPERFKKCTDMLMMTD